MFDPARLSTRTRRVAAAIVHRTWAFATAVGAVSPDDAAGRRYRAMGKGTCIAFPPGAVFGEHWISLGDDTLVGPNVSLAVGMAPGEPIDPDLDPILRIGSRCVIGRGSSIIARFDVEIEDDVYTGPNVYITDHNHRYDDVTTPIGRQWPAVDPVRIGAGSWLGTDVVILPGTTIGRHVTVGAGSVVRGVIPDFSVVVGSPAKVVRRYVEGEWRPSASTGLVGSPDGWKVSPDA
ncbi:MAG TPA: acyltransferase [Acidimicrobiales bacterium]|nr:acyltransferase [Acidimicrobiales bacterium]